MHLDTDQELSRSLDALLKNERWHETPVKGAQLSALIVALPKQLELKFFPLLYSKYRPILKEIKIEVMSGADDSGERDPRPMLIGQDHVKVTSQTAQVPDLSIHIPNLRLRGLKGLQPRVKLSLTLKSGVSHSLEARLFELLMHPPTDPFDR